MRHTVWIFFAVCFIFKLFGHAETFELNVIFQYAAFYLFDISISLEEDLCSIVCIAVFFKMVMASKEIPL